LLNNIITNKKAEKKAFERPSLLSKNGKSLTVKIEDFKALTKNKDTNC